MVFDPSLALGGLFAGTVVGLTGLGGAAIVTPMLLLIFGVSPSVAVSTDIVSAALMKPIGASVHVRRRTPHWPVVIALSLGSVPGVVIGTLIFTHLIGTAPEGQAQLKKMIGGVLLAAVVVTLLRLKLRGLAQAHAHTGLRFTRWRMAATTLIGLAVGIMVGLTSVGSGTLIAASLLVIFPAMLPSRMVGTDLVQAVPMLAVGALAHWGLGEVDVSVLVSLLVGQIPGVFLGARVSSRYNGHELRWLLLVLVGCSGLALLGLPTAIASVSTIVGCLALGLPILVKHRRGRADNTADPIPHQRGPASNVKAQTLGAGPPAA